jgi:hypothetical protein
MATKKVIKPPVLFSETQKLIKKIEDLKKIKDLPT